jgi:hypothetical protein
MSPEELRNGFLASIKVCHKRCGDVTGTRLLFSAVKFYHASGFIKNVTKSEILRNERHRGGILRMSCIPKK